MGGDGHTHHWVLSVASQQRHELNYSGLLVTLVVLLCLVGPSCNKAETTEPSDLTVVIQTPRSSFVFGQPIHLNVLFRNNLERTITVPGFNPEGLGGFGRSISVSALKYDEATKQVIAIRPIPRSGSKLPILSFGEYENGEVYFMIPTTTGRGLVTFAKRSK